MAELTLTPAQVQVLAILAEPGAYLVERWGGSGYYLITSDARNHPNVWYSTLLKFQRAGYIALTPRTYPHEYRVTPAGQERAAALTKTQQP